MSTNPGKFAQTAPMAVAIDDLLTAMIKQQLPSERWPIAGTRAKDLLVRMDTTEVEELFVRLEDTLAEYENAWGRHED